jgi:hypothetical protein
MAVASPPCPALMDAVSTAVFACSTMQDLGSLDGPFFVVVWRQGSLSAV